MNLLVKLKIDLDESLYLLDIPQDLSTLISHCKVVKNLTLSNKINQAIFFVTSKIALEKCIPSLLKSLQDDSLFWMAYPKKSGNIKSDLSRDEAWKIFDNTDWEPVTSISIDDNWTALRFRHQSQIKTLKRATPINDRVIEGIDFINRKVELPLDAIQAMKSFKGLKDFFLSLSFTHQKEYVEAIVTAKKPSTRQKRIEKMMEMVLKLQEQKLNKNNKK